MGFPVPQKWFKNIKAISLLLVQGVPIQKLIIRGSPSPFIGLVIDYELATACLML